MWCHLETRKPRGSYAKGTAKREEIVERAIEAFGKTGYHGTSMREIAQACGLSQAGLLHHFPSKEALLLAIVEYRETKAHDPAMHNSMDPGHWQENSMSQVLLNEQNEGLTRLWSNLVGEATDEAHPAHEYFKQRYQRARQLNAQLFGQLNQHQPPSQEDAFKASLLVAIWDGLQNQWLLDEDFDMKPIFKYALQMLQSYSAKAD